MFSQFQGCKYNLSGFLTPIIVKRILSSVETNLEQNTDIIKDFKFVFFTTYCCILSCKAAPPPGRL